MMQKSAQPWYREAYVWLLILFPASAVLAGFYTLHLAIVSDDGLVVDDYYKQGLEINQSLARDQAAIAHKLRGLLRIDQEAGRIQLQLLADTAYSLPQQLQLKFAYATRAGFDQTVLLARSAAQSYEAALPVLIDGDWHVQLEGDDWRLHSPAKLPDATQLILGDNRF